MDVCCILTEAKTEEKGRGERIREIELKSSIDTGIIHRDCLIDDSLCVQYFIFQNESCTGIAMRQAINQTYLGHCLEKFDNVIKICRIS